MHRSVRHLVHTAHLVIGALLGSMLLATAAAQSPERAVAVSNGLNTFALQSADDEALAVLAHRENFNAHGFDVLTLYARQASTAGEPAQWQLVPWFDGDQERLNVVRAGGADCLLHDFRLLRATAQAPALLVLADRDLGPSFASPAPVRLRVLALRRNDEGLVGRPVLYFEVVRDFRARKTACDVGDALSAELGLPSRP